MDSHEETVSALVWLPDDSGFMSASLDRKVVAWVKFYSISRPIEKLIFSQDASGKQADEWPGIPVRVTDMAVSPDMTRLVVIGMGYQSTASSSSDRLSTRGTSQESPPNAVGTGNGAQPSSEHCIVIYDFKAKALELCVVFVV